MEHIKFSSEESDHHPNTSKKYELNLSNEPHSLPHSLSKEFKFPSVISEEHQFLQLYFRGVWLTIVIRLAIVAADIMIKKEIIINDMRR